MNRASILVLLFVTIGHAILDLVSGMDSANTTNATMITASNGTSEEVAQSSLHHEVFIAMLIAEGKLTFSVDYTGLIITFHQIDRDRDHRVSKPELTAWIHDRILEYVAKSKADASTQFSHLDQDNDGYVEWDDYIERGNDGNATEMDQNELLEKQTWWNQVDLRPTDGQLDLSEFTDFLRPSLSVSALNAQAQDMFDALDTNANGTIGNDEFSAVPHGGDSDQDEEELELDRIYQMERQAEFNNMDTDGDGQVTMDELTHYLDLRNPQHAEKEADYLIRTSDSDRDGRLSEYEMLMNYILFSGSSLVLSNIGNS